MPGRLLRTDRGYGPRWYPAHALSGVAQLAERRTVNPQVVGSSPTPGATNMQVRVGLSGPALFMSKLAGNTCPSPSTLPSRPLIIRRLRRHGRQPTTGLLRGNQVAGPPSDRLFLDRRIKNSQLQAEPGQSRSARQTARQGRLGRPGVDRPQHSRSTPDRSLGHTLGGQPPGKCRRIQHR